MTDVYVIKIIWLRGGYRIQVKVILAAQKKFWGSNAIRITHDLREFV